MARLRAGEASAVVVYRMSRFGRDFYETVRTVRPLHDEASSSTAPRGGSTSSARTAG